MNFTVGLKVEEKWNPSSLPLALSLSLSTMMMMMMTQCPLEVIHKTYRPVFSVPLPKEESVHYTSMASFRLLVKCNADVF